jgi:amino acid transporter
MSLKNEANAPGEKPADDVPAYKPGSLSDHARGRQFSIDPEDRAIVAADQNMLHRNLKGRHMQMIAM